MASAGAHSDHVNHVSTQLPYSLTVAGVSIAGYLVAGALGYSFGNSTALLALPVTIFLLIMVLVFLRKFTFTK